MMDVFFVCCVSISQQGWNVFLRISVFRLMNMYELFYVAWTTLPFSSLSSFFFPPLVWHTEIRTRTGAVRAFICERAYLCERANEQTGHDCRDTLLQRRDKAVSLFPPIKNPAFSSQEGTLSPLSLSALSVSVFVCAEFTHTRARCFAGGGEDWFAINLLWMSF